MEVCDITQDSVALHLNVDPRTVRNILSGKSITIPRLKKICDFTDLDYGELEHIAASSTTTSSPRESLKYGGYPFNTVDKYIGHYVAVRYSLTERGKLYCSHFSIFWSHEEGALGFKEYQKFTNASDRARDYSQSGSIHISPDIGLLHFLTTWRGAVRLITLSKLRLASQIMYGAVLTQAAQRFGFIPSISPMFLQKIMEEHIDQQTFPIGPIGPDDSHYVEWFDNLQVAEQEYIVTGSGLQSPL